MPDNYSDFIYNDAWSWMTEEERKDYKKTHAQAAIEQAIKKKSLIQRLVSTVKHICEK